MFRTLRDTRALQKKKKTITDDKNNIDVFFLIPDSKTDTSELQPETVISTRFRFVINSTFFFFFKLFSPTYFPAYIHLGGHGHNVLLRAMVRYYSIRRYCRGKPNLLYSCGGGDIIRSYYSRTKKYQTYDYPTTWVFRLFFLSPSPPPIGVFFWKCYSYEIAEITLWCLGIVVDDGLHLSE